MTTLATSDLLGDLYQQLHADARKGRALVQTPPFVRDFILDHTLTPALRTFGLRGTRLIDPACGTGHFLVDAFKRIWAAWWELGEAERDELLYLAWGPDGPPIKTAVAQLALYQVYGVDLDPNCVEIARYRLTQLAAELAGAQCVAFTVNVYQGDALLHGRPMPGDDERFGPWPYDAAKVREVLRPGQYTAVVANPPYITGKDAALREAYRERYPTCHGKFSLGVPFTELCFGLAARGAEVSPMPTVAEKQGQLFAEVGGWTT